MIIRSRFADSEHTFYRRRMLTVNDVDAIRRSAAIAPLSNDEALRVLEACDQLLRERARIAVVLADLPASWANVRKVLNELQTMVAPN
jgi:acetate kinase